MRWKYFFQKNVTNEKVFFYLEIIKQKKGIREYLRV